MTIRSNDIEKDREMLIKIGVPIIREMKEFWSHVLVFEDTEGNVHRLIKRIPWQNTYQFTNPETTNAEPFSDG